jgi:hypothetical protein
LQLIRRREKYMTLFEIQKYVLSLNDGQRLAFIIGVINHYKISDTLSRGGLESLLLVWQPDKAKVERRWGA